MSLIPYLYDFQRPLQMMEREFYHPNDLFGHLPFHLTPRDFYGPRCLRSWDNALRPWNNLIRPMEQLSAAMSQLAFNDLESNITADDEKFQVNVDVQHFAPEEINVKVIDGKVIVEGKHKEKRDEHGYISRQFVRKYALPQGCLPDTVESKLSSDGVLTVTAPKVLAMPSIGERIVPISHTGPVQKQIGSPDLSDNSAEGSK